MAELKDTTAPQKSQGWWLLRQPRFRTVIGGEALSIFGDYAYQVAFAWLVLTVSHSTVVLGAVMLCNVIPNGLLILVGGAVVDRWSPRRVMFCSHVARGVLVALLLVLFMTGDTRVWQFFVIAAAFGVADAFFWPAGASVLPALVDPGDLPRANAIQASAEQVALLLGPVLGGAVTSAFSPGPVLAIDVVTFLIAAVTVQRIPAAAPVGGAGDSVRELLAKVRSGLSYARRTPDVRAVFTIVAASTLSYSGLFSVGFPAFAKASGRGALALGILVGCWGAGQLAGAVSAGVTGLPRRWGLLIIGMACCEGTCFAIIGAISFLQVAYVLIALLGFGVAYSMDVALPTWIQVRTPPEMLGRVNSVITFPRAALQPLSIAVMAALAAVSARLPFLFAGATMLGAGAVLALSPTTRALSSGPGQDSSVQGE